MHIIKIDPRALKDNPDDARRSKSNPQSDSLMLATIKAVGIIQPPVVSPEADGGNGFIIQAGHRRTRQASALLRSTGPRKASPQHCRFRCARSGNSGCSPMCCPPCSTRCQKATCPMNGNSG